MQQIAKKISYLIGYFSAFIEEENLKLEALICLTVLFILLLVL